MCIQNNLVLYSYNKIKEMIFTYKIAPGEVLSDYNLSGKLNISRTPIRQALLMLLSDGIVEKNNSSFNVVKLDRYFLDSLYEARLCLEPYIIKHNENIDLEKAEELIKSIAIASANDSAVAMAEAISGTTANFVSRMNSRAKELGCKNTNFKNVHGLDEEGHYSTAYDMSLIARELLKHEQILKYTSTYEAYLNKPNGTSTWMVNTNKLIKYYTGLDGLKTGFTKTAGYCLTSTAKRNDMRLISVVMKEPSSQVRNSETISLLNYGFSNYKIKTILKKDQKLGTIEVQNGKKELADITILEDATNLESINDNKEYSFNIVTDKVKAPLKKGDKVGTLELTEQGTVIKRLNITVKENIPKANIWDLYKRNFKSIIIGSIH